MGNLVETAVYVLLGFLAASLCALISVPAISRRAFRLAEARVRLTSPASAAQARADLDSLRGRHAIEITLVERRAETAAEASAAAQIELGRRAAEIHNRDVAIQAGLLDIAEQRRDLSDVRKELRERDVENAALQMGYHDLTRQRDVAAARVSEAGGHIASLETHQEENRAAIATLQTRSTVLAMEVDDLRRKSEHAADRAQSMIAELESHLETSRTGAKSLASRLADLDARHSALKTEAEGRGAEASRLRERLAELEPKLKNSESTREALALESSRQTARTAERIGDLQRLVALRKEEVDRLNERLAALAARENDQTLRVQALTAARADAEGALRAARADNNEAASQELGSQRESRVTTASTGRTSAIGDQMLRQAIIRLGRKLAGVSDFTAMGDAEIIAFNPRDLAEEFHLGDEPSRRATHVSEA